MILLDVLDTPLPSEERKELQVWRLKELTVKKALCHFPLLLPVIFCDVVFFLLFGLGGWLHLLSRFSYRPLGRCSSCAICPSCRQPRCLYYVQVHFLTVVLLTTLTLLTRWNGAERLLPYVFALLRLRPDRSSLLSQCHAASMLWSLVYNNQEVGVCGLQLAFVVVVALL